MCAIIFVNLLAFRPVSFLTDITTYRREIIYHWTENIKDNLEKTSSDAILSIAAPDLTRKFHIEFGNQQL